MAAVDAILREDLAAALDPVRFARRLGIEPDPWQAEVLRSPAKRIILNCCRQSGKSTVASLLALHTALYCPPALVLLLSPSLRQSSELFRKVMDFYGEIAAELPPSEAESALRLELANGSRIVSLPGKEQTIRGFSGVNLLVVDEAARVSDELYTAVRPMLAVSGGKLVLLSTPAGKRGFFYREWVEGGPDWLRIKVTADQCPRISPEFLVEERRALPPEAFRAEYMGEFAESLSAFLPEEVIRRAVCAEVKAWQL